ncbi:hypothetical protein SPHFLASMR4Y_01713 [Sphingorhabdus sp. SMR4y]|nr:hypothetical protein SPHFLASMR4Y_01713 [Sphingorhabdus sp. SMR4y]
MPPAVAIAGVAAAATVGGAVVSSNAQKKAANQASQTAQDTADANNALTRDIYNQNYQVLNPYAQRGNDAGNAINALLGLGVPQEQGGPAAATIPNTGTQTFNPGYSGLGNPRDDFGPPSFNDSPIYNGYWPSSAAQQQTAVNTTQTAQSDPQADYENAFQNYQNSTGYQFRVNEGNNALNTGYAANGALRSGAAMKDFARFNQNIASDEFGNYLAQLGNQQNVGLAGASAIAGVGQNYVNNVTANNNSAATVAANAALAKGQANANMYGGIASGIGNFLGTSFG